MQHGAGQNAASPVSLYEPSCTASGTRVDILNMNVFRATEQLVRGFLLWTKHLTNGSSIVSGVASDLYCSDHPSPKLLGYLRKAKTLFIPQVAIL